MAPALTKEEKQRLYWAFTNLFTSHALAWLKQKRPDFELILEEVKSEAIRSVSYPDGTLLIEGGDSYLKLRSLLIKEQLFASGGIWGGPSFASVEPFPRKSYKVWYTAEYAESLGEIDFNVIYPRMHTFPTSDYQISNLLITVVFKRRPSQKTKHKVAEFLSAWFQSVTDVGLFGDGPIRKVSEDVLFRGERAQFRLDGSRSGQDTLNWLLVSVLNFGYEVSAVEQFVFNHEKQLKAFLGPFDENIENIIIK